MGRLQVDFELWTNTNDECGPLCDEQRAFIKAMKPWARALQQSGNLTFTPHVSGVVGHASTRMALVLHIPHASTFLASIIEIQCAPSHSSCTLSNLPKRSPHLYCMHRLPCST